MAATGRSGVDRGLWRWIAFSAGLLLVVAAGGCGRPAKPIEESVLLPLPDGYVVVDDSFGHAFECDPARSCWRSWEIDPPGAAAGVDHVAVIAAHVGRNVDKELRFRPAHVSGSPAGYVHPGRELWLSVEAEADGLIHVHVSDSGGPPNLDSPMLGLLAVVLAGGLPVLAWSIRDDRRRRLHQVEP